MELRTEIMFCELDEDAFDVIVSVTGANELEEVKEQYREEGRKINTREAIRGMIADGREEGIKEGWTQGQKEKAYATTKNMYSRGFTAEDTAGLLAESMETVVKWFEEWSAAQK